MKLVFLTDTHFRGDPGFYQSGEDFIRWFVDSVSSIKEPFIVLHGGDVYHRSQDNGATNGLVRLLFQSLCDLPNCVKIYIVEGNHDKKKETGSALDMLRGFSPKLDVIGSPTVFFAGKNNTFPVYCLPHITPTMGADISLYNDSTYHDMMLTCDGVKREEVWLSTCHAGDESAGFFKAVDLSCLPANRVNGDIHKRVSVSYPGATNPTRRDERDRECFYRIYDTEKSGYEEVPIPLFLNFITVEYGEDLDDFFLKNPGKKPKTVAIVDIKNHDFKEDVLKEYRDKYEERYEPFYIFDEVIHGERRGEEEDATDSEEGLPSISVLDQFREFCKEKNIGCDVKEILESKLKRGVLTR